MDDNDAVIIGFIIFIVTFVFRKIIARKIIEGQNKFWGIKLGVIHIKIGEIMIPIMALLFFIFILLVKFGVIK